MTFCNGMTSGRLGISCADATARRSKPVLGILCAIALALSFGSQAFAKSIPWGDPVLSHSWFQPWMASYDGGFDAIQAQILVPPAATFESPGFVDFSDSSWVGTSIPPLRQANASGSLTYALEFNIRFNNLPTDYTSDNPLGMLFGYYSGGQLVQQEYWVYDGSKWVDPPIPGVPDGGLTVILLGISTIGLGWARRKLK